MWNHEDQQRFLADMEANPGSAEHAHRFADWLESVGKPAHAEIIRLHTNKPEEELHGRGRGGFVSTYGNNLNYPFTKFIHSFGASSTYPKGPEEKSYTSLALRLPSRNSITFSVMLPSHLGSKLHEALKEEGTPSFDDNN